MIGRFVHEKLNALMDQHGWIITGVPGKALYTVGLTRMKNHPELAIHGISARQAGALLDVAARHVLEDDHVYDLGLHANVAAGYACKVVDVHPSNFHDWFGQALDFVGPLLQMRQILWCDKEGRFPGDSQYDPKFKHQLRFDVRRPEYDL